MLAAGVKTVFPDGLRYIKQNLVDHKWETIIVPDILTLKEFSEKIWVSLPKLIAEFMKNWMMVTLNSKIDFADEKIRAWLPWLMNLSQTM